MRKKGTRGVYYLCCRCITRFKSFVGVFFSDIVAIIKRRLINGIGIIRICNAVFIRRTQIVWRYFSLSVILNKILLFSNSTYTPYLFFVFDLKFHARKGRNAKKKAENSCSISKIMQKNDKNAKKGKNVYSIWKMRKKSRNAKKDAKSTCF